MRILFSLVFAAFLFSSCTPLAQLKEEDFDKTEKVLNIGYSDAYRNLLKGLRDCPTNNYESNLYTDRKEGEFYMFLQPASGNRDGLGYVVLKEDPADPSKTRVNIKMRNDFNFTNRLSNKYLQYLMADYSDCDQ